jgi:predicted site-specific integrase-resolvase
MTKTNPESAQQNLSGPATALETTNSKANAARAVIYARAAFANKNSNNSINEQIATCEKFIKRNGWTTVHVYRDGGKSGITLDRPEFQLMLENATSRRFDVVVVSGLDRLSRSLEHLVNVEKILNENGVKLCSVNEYPTKPKLSDLIVSLSNLNPQTGPGQNTNQIGAKTNREGA